MAWSDRDRHPYVAPAAATGIVVAILLARFGMPPLNIHGPLHFYGVMDPVCGMTRGVASALGGDLARAIWYNPASPLVLVGGAAGLARSIYGQRTGRWLNVSFRSPARVAALTVLIASLEVNQQLHAERLLLG